MTVTLIFSNLQQYHVWQLHTWSFQYSSKMQIILRVEFRPTAETNSKILFAERGSVLIKFSKILQNPTILKCMQSTISTQLHIYEIERRFHSSKIEGLTIVSGPAKQAKPRQTGQE